MSEVVTAAPVAARPGAPRSTHFRFEHKVFGVQGARFALTPDTQEAALYVLLGELPVGARGADQQRGDVQSCEQHL